jgi:transposase
LGKPNNHKGTARPQPIPSEKVKLRLDRCPKCHKKLGRPVKIEKRIIEEIPKPQPVRVIEYSIAYYHCSHCNKDVTPTHPNLPSLRGKFGVNLMSKVAFLKYSERFPNRKIEELLKRDYGLDITPSTIFEMTNRVAKTLDSDYREIIERIRDRKVVNVDETGVKVNGILDMGIYYFKKRH